MNRVNEVKMQGTGAQGIKGVNFWFLKPTGLEEGTRQAKVS